MWYWFIPVYIVCGILVARWGNNEALDGNGKPYPHASRTESFWTFVFWPALTVAFIVITINDIRERRKKFPKAPKAPGKFIQTYDFIMGRK